MRNGSLQRRRTKLLVTKFSKIRRRNELMKRVFLPQLIEDIFRPNPLLQRIRRNSWKS